MKKLVILACLAATVALSAGAAMADSIKGRVGVTGKMGLLIPSDNHRFDRTDSTDAGFVGGGGLIYGIDDHFAADLDLTYAAFDSDFGDFGVTNLSFGGQYRFMPQSRFVPYVGGGLDVIFADFDSNDGAATDIDTTLGAHASGGVDFFINRQLALTAEAKLVVARDADINGAGGRVGEFDPTSFSSTVGIRYFFN